MNVTTQAVSKKALWIGWVLSVLPAGLLVMSGIMKFVRPPGFAEGLDKMGWPERLMTPLAVVELGSTALFLFPRTAMIGAILLTGYMGGAIATHVRIGEPFFLQALLPVVLWLGLYLREPRLRAILPLR